MRWEGWERSSIEALALDAWRSLMWTRVHVIPAGSLGKCTNTRYDHMARTEVFKEEKLLFILRVVYVNQQTLH